MLNLKEHDIDFSIKITISYDELSNSGLWNDNLNELTKIVINIRNTLK